MEKSVVSLVAGNPGGHPSEYGPEHVSQVRELLERCIELLGGWSATIGHPDYVVVKPNIVEVPFPATGGSVVTDPRLLEALVQALRDYGIRRVVVAEGRSVNLKHEGHGPRQAFEKLGFDRVIRRAGGEVLGWDEEPYVPIDVPGGELYEKVNVPRSLVECDAFISVPKLKTHCQTGITVGMKAMQGVFSVDEKVDYHNEAFPWKIVDMLRALRPTVTIVDGLIAGEGYGPIYTEPVEMNILLASQDVVAVDAVAASVIGMDPLEVPLTRLGHSEGIGTADMERIEIRGESIESVRRVFKRPIWWNPIGAARNVRVFAGGACRFCLAQIGAALTRLKLEGKLDELDEICVIVGSKAPVPRKQYRNVFIIGDCAAQETPVKGTVIGGCPPLPSIQIVHAFERHLRRRSDAGHDGDGSSGAQTVHHGTCPQGG